MALGIKSFRSKIKIEEIKCYNYNVSLLERPDQIEREGEMRKERVSQVTLLPRAYSSMSSIVPAWPAFHSASLACLP